MSWSNNRSKAREQMMKYLNKNTVIRFWKWYVPIVERAKVAAYVVAYGMCALIGLFVVLMIAVVVGSDYYESWETSIENGNQHIARKMVTEAEAAKKVKTYQDNVPKMAQLAGKTASSSITAEALGLPLEAEALAEEPIEKAVAIKELSHTKIVSRSYRHQPTLDEIKQWPVTTIRETKGQISWDEQQYFQFYGTNDGGSERRSGENSGYQGITELKPYRNEKARRYDKRPVMMLKRVMFTEDLLGKWEVASADSEEAGNRNEGDGCWVEFLSHHRYRENQVRCEKDHLFGEEWLLEIELVGTWVVKPELRTIMVYVEEVKLKQRQGWSEAAATDLKLKLRGLSQWEIETVAEEGIEIDPGEDLRFSLVKMD